jgi:hypothetical protein
MKRKVLSLLTVAAILSIFNASGQNGQALYFMNLPQNHMMNPALRPSNSVYVGLPVLSGFSFNVNNNFVNFSDIFMNDQSSDSVITFLHPDYDVNRFLGKLHRKNSFSPEMSVPVLGIGFAAGKDGYFFLDINDRVEGNVVIPKDLITLLLNGNGGFVGSRIDLSSLRCDAKYFREFGLGFSRNFTDKLRLGVKAKMLFGIADMSIKNKSLGINVNDDYSHVLDADLAVNISAPLNVYMNDENHIDSVVFDDNRFKTAKGVRNFLLQSGNPGFAIDAGATYDLTDRIQLSAAVTDLGFIRWSKDVTTLVADSRFNFSGLSMDDVLNGDKTFKEVGDDMLDSLKDAFTISRKSQPYSTWLPTAVTLGGSYMLTKDVSLGFMSYSKFIGKQVREALTLSANVNLGNAFSTSLGYTITNHRADNLGFGMAFRTGFTQFYFLTDRLPLTWNKISGDNTLLIPSNWNTISLRAGMNLCFGNRIGKKKDIPMIDVQ